MPLPVPSPGRTVAGLCSPGGIGSPPCRVVSWSPRSPWSPVVPVGGSALLPPRVAGSPQQHPHAQHAQLRPGSMVVPAGSLQLPPGQPKAGNLQLVLLALIGGFGLENHPDHSA